MIILLVLLAYGHRQWEELTTGRHSHSSEPCQMGANSEGQSPVLSIRGKVPTSVLNHLARNLFAQITCYFQGGTFLNRMLGSQGHKQL